MPPVLPLPLEEARTVAAAAAAPMPATAMLMVAMPIPAVLTRALRPSFVEVKRGDWHWITFFEIGLIELDIIR